MSDLTEMWAALERYQPRADKAGHGDTWRVMCRERASDAALAAYRAAPKGSAAEAAAWKVLAVFAAEGWPAWSVWSNEYAQQAINAIKEVQP